MTRVILIRHGETLWNREGRMQGQSDSPLSATGERQAQLLAQRLRTMEFGVLYSSDLGRAHRTASSIAGETGHEVVVDARLRERHFGIFEGLTSAEIADRHPQEYPRFTSRDPDYAIPGGESARAFRERCLACLSEIAQRHAGDVVVAVSHGLVLDMIYRAALGLDLSQPRGLPLLNASLNTFFYVDGGWQALEVGDVNHLDADAVTQFRGHAA